jgi:hypothetical protein
MLKIVLTLLAFCVAATADEFTNSGASLQFKDSADTTCTFVKDGDAIALNSGCDLRVRGSSLTSVINHVNGPIASKEKLDALFAYVHAKDCPDIVGTDHLAHVDGARTHGNGFCRSVFLRVRS